MILKKFDKLPMEFQNDSVLKYYEILKKKRTSILLKRIFDFTMSSLLLLGLSPILFIIAICVKLDSPGNAIFKQKRITRYGKEFYIYKFRTMYQGSERGSQVTINNDVRITKVGRVLRQYRIDELLQLINILKGEMSFVGTRPEVKKYVECYSDEMYATLLLPAGVTSLASIKYKDEDRLLSDSSDLDNTYINEILKDKMKFNLEYIDKFSIWYDFRLMISTIFAVLKKDDKNIGKVETESEKINV